MPKTLKLVLAAVAVLLVVFLLLPSGARDTNPDFPESAEIVIDGVRLHYRVWTPDGPSKANVLLVHGLGGSTFSWRYTAPHLAAQGYTTVSVDLPGFGYSDRARGLDHSQQNRSSLLWKLLDHVESQLVNNPEGPQIWNLVGHSMGGGTITAMAHSRPEHTRSLAYAAGSVFRQPPRSAGFLFRIPVISSLLAHLARFFLLTENRITDTLTSAYGRTPTADEITGYLAPLKLPGTETALLDITSSQGEPVETYLPHIQAPALLIWGAEDTWVPLSEGEQLAAALPQAELHSIPGSSHCPMETHPEIFNKLLTDFLKQVPSET